MHINIIVSPTCSQYDVNLLKGIFTAFFDKNTRIRTINYHMFECDQANINIFIHDINPVLLHFASRNVWIPDTNRLPSQEYIDMVDEIWTKTSRSSEIVGELTSIPIHEIGWTSIDRGYVERVNYYKAFVSESSDLVFTTYDYLKTNNLELYNKLPTIYGTGNHPEICDKYQTIIENEFDTTIKSCGLYIDLTTDSEFNHFVNESASNGTIVIQNNQANCLYDTLFTEPTRDSLILALDTYANATFQVRKGISENIRTSYEKNHKQWIATMRKVIGEDQPEYRLNDYLPKEDELPDVSIVCITRDRREFMAILKYCYMIQSYPEEKLELVIVDDGEDNIEDTLIGVPNVKYVRLTEPATIGQKRNIGVENAMYDYIVFMDDDDIYGNNSVLQRIIMLMKQPSRGCVFSTTIPCYDIENYTSFINMPPVKLPLSQRVSEASMAFTREFWNQRKFTDIQVSEGDAFISGREQMCREISPREVLISLLHSKNTSSRRIPKDIEPNGCHYGLNDNLFKVISEIGESLKAKHASSSGLSAGLLSTSGSG